VQTSPLSETIISKAHSQGWAFVLEYLKFSDFMKIYFLLSDRPLTVSFKTIPVLSQTSDLLISFNNQINQI
jgi:hypothetical protein